MISSPSIKESLSYISSRTSARPRVALILGSGLGNFGDEVAHEHVIDSAEIPYYPTSSVQGHRGRLIFGRIREGVRESPLLLVFQGRVHFYETMDIEKVIYPIAIAAAIGVTSLIVTNAAGGINRSFSPGDLMLIKDFVNLTGLSLDFSRATTQSKNQRFFSPRLQRKFNASALTQDVVLREGTYCWLKGPSYETAAEIQMLKSLGVDAVGMSTVPEIVFAKHLGIRTVGVSLISNLATGISAAKLSHEEVTETAQRVKNKFTSLMKDFLLSLKLRVA